MLRRLRLSKIPPEWNGSIERLRGLLSMTRNEYRAEAKRLRRLSRSAVVTYDAALHYRGLATLFETLAKADDALIRSAAIWF